MPSVGPGEPEPLSQRFIRCHHCGLPHNLSDEVCPITGKRIRRKRQENAAPGDKDEPQHMPIPLVHRQPPSSRRAPRAIHDPQLERGDLVGRIIGDKYRVTDLIGEGGMGTVYEAEHLTIGRRVAIKVLNRAHLGRREAVARFHQEARAAGAIGHPNICEIYDVGRLDDGAPYLVMERLHGSTLADRINLEGALPFEDVSSLLTQVLSALVAAHDKKIIHRDIKPENVFLTERVGCAPVVKILDFGISKTGSDQGDLSLTRTGMVMGTPFYMAPEQARGEPIDHRVDIYACGVMLYEILTGRRPFLASNYNALVVQVLSAQPRDPREIRPAIPSAFVPVVFKALSKKREDRFDDAASFIEALSRVQAEIDRGPTNAEIKKLAEEVRRTNRPPPLPSDVPPSDSMDIPVVFSETGTGQQAIVMETGEVPVEIDTGPQEAADDDPTQVGRNANFLHESRMGDRLLRAADRGGDDDEDTDDGEVHDTIVDPSGAMLGELWSQLGRAEALGVGDVIQAPKRAAGGAGPVSLGSVVAKDSPGDPDSTLRTGGMDSDRAERVLSGAEHPDDGDAEHGGRYSLVSSFPESDREPSDDREVEERTTEKPSMGERAPNPRAKPPRPSPVERRPARTDRRVDQDEPDDDAVTTLFVASEDGPREVGNGKRGSDGSSPEIPRPPGTPRFP